MRFAVLLLVGTIMTGCMEHYLYSVVLSEDPTLYQTVVLDFMCSQTCEWQDVDTCWEELEGHRSFCVDSTERLDPGLVDRCLQLMSALPSGECSYLPEECLLSSVTMIPDRDCVKR